MAKIFIILISVIILQACGGGGGSSSSVVASTSAPVISTTTPTIATPPPSTQLNQSPSTNTSCIKDALSSQPSQYEIESRGMNYPATVRSLQDPSTVLMFTGDFAYKASQTMLQSTPRGKDHIRYESAQEEIWVGELSSSLTAWAQERRYAFGVEPETQLSAQSNATYDQIYSTGFPTTCRSDFQQGQCNVQINDATVVTFNREGQDQYLLYFTMLENVRWHSNQFGNLGASGPNNPQEQNIHSIGLATSTDSKTWKFYDKVISESELDSNGKPILGAWSPSAIAIDNEVVRIYFHDALGTKQYVADLGYGTDLLAIERLNPEDEIYRVNLDVLESNNGFEVMYNNADFDIVRTRLTEQDQFATACDVEVVVAAPDEQMLPTPHQLIGNDGKRYVFYWDFQNDSAIRVNVYDG